MKNPTKSQMIRWLQYRGLAKLKLDITPIRFLDMSIEEIKKLYKKSGGKTKLNLPNIKL